MLSKEMTPKTWGKVFYQDSTVNVLKQSIIDGKPVNNIVLEGKSGIGKTSLGTLFAASVTCMDIQPDGNPCGKCVSCEDVFEDIFARTVKKVNGITDNGIDFYRNELDSLFNSGSLFGNRKVLIVDEVQGLSKESLNAFLVPLESNKNPNIFFIFTTTEGWSLKETLLSRCLDFKLSPPNELEVSKYLVSIIQDMKIRMPETFLTEGIFEIACASEGNIRQALSTLDKVLIAKDFSVEGIKKQLELEIETDLFKIIKLLIEGKTSLAIMDLVKLMYSGDANKTFNKMFRQCIDIHRHIVSGHPLNKPVYERYINANFEPTDEIKKLIDVLYETKKDSGYYIDINMLVYKLSESL